MNTKFKRVLALVLCLAMAVTVFVGCGKKVSDKDEQGRTVVTIGGYPAEGTKARTTFDEKLAKFSAANPDIAVTPLEWSFDIKAFYSQAAGGQLPTLFNTAYTEVNPAVNAGYIADITDLLKENKFYDNLNPQILDALSPDGNVYSFPMSSYVLGLWVNIDMFEKAGLMNEDGTPMQPKTWDEFAEFCVKIRKQQARQALHFQQQAMLADGSSHLSHGHSVVSSLKKTKTVHTPQYSTALNVRLLFSSSRTSDGSMMFFLRTHLLTTTRDIRCGQQAKLQCLLTSTVLQDMLSSMIWI